MKVIKISSRTDSKGEVLVNVGIPNVQVHIAVSIPDPKDQQTDEERRKEWEEFVRRTEGSIKDPSFRRHPLSQADWAKQFDELAAQINPSTLERVPQEPIRDPFS